MVLPPVSLHAEHRVVVGRSTGACCTRTRFQSASSSSASSIGIAVSTPWPISAEPHITVTLPSPVRPQPGVGREDGRCRRLQARADQPVAGSAKPMVSAGAPLLRKPRRGWSAREGWSRPCSGSLHQRADASWMAARIWLAGAAAADVAAHRGVDVGDRSAPSSRASSAQALMIWPTGGSRTAARRPPRPPAPPCRCAWRSTPSMVVIFLPRGPPAAASSRDTGLPSRCTCGRRTAPRRSRTWCR